MPCQVQSREQSLVSKRDTWTMLPHALTKAGCDALVINIAHGHSTLGINAMRAIKEALLHVQVVIGNVATAEGT